MASPFNINVSLHAAKAIAEVAPEIRSEIQHHLSQLAELAGIAPPSAGFRASTEESRPMRFTVGPMSVKYVVSEESRTITVTELVRARAGA